MWNQIAAQESARTKWGKRMALTSNALDKMLEAELLRLAVEGDRLAGSVGIRQGGAAIG